MAGGRPTTYSDESAAEIIERMCEGESLRSICRDAHMPVMSTVMLWKVRNPEFSNQYESAMQSRAQHLFDELLEIADDSSRDKIVDENGNERANTEVVGRSRLRVDTRKWALSKMLPKVYGDKVEQIVSNPEGESFRTQTTWTVQPVAPLDLINAKPSS